MEHCGESSQPATDRPSVIYKDLPLIQVAALIFLVDQITKFLVQKFLFFGESLPREGFLRISHVHNTGSAFGLFQGQNTPLIVVAFVGIAILVLIYHSQRQPSVLLRISIGLQLGGALGNVVDRLFLGYVIDFLDVGPWPVFNVADSSIVVGLVLLGWLFLVPHQQSRRGQRMADVIRETVGVIEQDSVKEVTEALFGFEDPVLGQGLESPQSLISDKSQAVNRHCPWCQSPVQLNWKRCPHCFRWLPDEPVERVGG